MMRFARVGRAGVFVLSLALAGLGAERAAAACGTSGVNCINPTPVCVTPLFPLFGPGTCEACSSANTCPTPGQICVTQGATAGSCVTPCAGDYVDGGTSTCTAAQPACVAGACMQCTPNVGQDPHCKPDAPDCDTSGLCSCSSATTCPSGDHCDTAGGAFGVGACVSTCSSSASCGTGACVFDGGLDDGTSDAGQCEQCFGTHGCDAPLVCNATTFTCVTPPDAGTEPGDGGGPASGNDAGGLTDGGGSSRDATVGGDGGDETDGGYIYRYGTTEGGGCSLLPGASGTGRTPVIFGFAGLAGLLFLRRSQRRSDRKRNARR
jgi:hypothetical protein